MKANSFKRFMSVGLLLVGQLNSNGIAGEASGGGVPEVNLATCEGSLLITAPIGEETTKIKAYILDKEILKETEAYAVKYSFVGDRVVFMNKASVPANELLHIAIGTNSNNGVFSGVLKLGTKSKTISCKQLDDRFRPLLDEKLGAAIGYYAKKCDSQNQCVGFSAVTNPMKNTVLLKFNPKTGKLEGGWRVEDKPFDDVVVFEVAVSRKRDQPYVVEHKISTLREPNPTVVKLEGLNQRVELQTPALKMGENTLSVMSISQVKAY